MTTETVRRDLSVLERAGILRRVHGGAVPAAALTALEAKVGDRDLAHADEKDRIAKRAVSLLPADRRQRAARRRHHDRPAGDDDPPRPAADRGHQRGPHRRAAGRLPQRRPAPAARPGPLDHPRRRRRGHGGRARPAQADVAFVGTNGLSVAHGLSTPDHAEAAAKRAMVGAAHQVVVLVDSSKIGQEHMVRFARVADIDVVVTDAGISDADRAALERLDVEVVIA